MFSLEEQMRRAMSNRESAISAIRSLQALWLAERAIEKSRRRESRHAKDESGQQIKRLLLSDWSTALSSTLLHGGTFAS